MQLNKTLYNPFIRRKDNTTKVMLDVVIALLPCLFVSYLAFGLSPLAVVAISVGTALVSEYIFSLIFLNRTDTLNDGSAVVTGILIAFTLGAFTPWYVVSFGATMSVIFGKLLWGGLGRNIFNPALIGREFMTIFFPAVMTSGSIWYNNDHASYITIKATNNDFINQLLFKPTGAIGEYSILLLSLGGLYLLLRHRISWHIPFTLFVTFTVGLFVIMYFFSEKTISFSLGGLMIGAIFMATDMPSSASTTGGKCYFGAMIGLAAIIFIFHGVRYEYMSYSILLLNGFSGMINWIFRSRVWGSKPQIAKPMGQIMGIFAVIILAVFAIIKLHEIGGIQYLLYVFILYCIIRFIVTDTRLKIADTI